MMKNVSEYQILADNISDFHECSRDDRDKHDVKYMDVPSSACVNFDNAVTEYVNSNGCSKDSAASVDSLVRDQDGNPVLIEFKNGRLTGRHSGDSKTNIREKMCNSILILEDILSEKWTNLNKSMDFILVYNESVNPCGYANAPVPGMHEHMAGKEAGTKNLDFGSRNIRFGLERYQKLYYRNVYTVTEEEFTEAVNSGRFMM